MHDKMKKLMEKKKEGKLSKNEVAAKSHVLKELSDDMGDIMKDRLHGLKKVTVAAPSKAGLKEGLKMAEKITEKMPIPEESGMGEAKEKEEEMVADAEDGKGMKMGDEAEEAAEEHEEEEGEEQSKEELLAEIERLKAKIEKMS